MSSRPAHTVVAGEGGGEWCGRRPSGDGARSCMKRELHQKLSGDEVHHTSSFISLVNNTLFSILHCQKALDSILCSCNTPPSEEPPSGGGGTSCAGRGGGTTARHLWIWEGWGPHDAVCAKVISVERDR